VAGGDEERLAVAWDRRQGLDGRVVWGLREMVGWVVGAHVSFGGGEGGGRASPRVGVRYPRLTCHLQRLITSIIRCSASRSGATPRYR
jgi:hypothetical protein